MLYFLYLSLFFLTLFIRRKMLDGLHLHADPKFKNYYTNKQPRSERLQYCGMDLKGSPSFIIKEEKWYHRFFIKTGFASELTTGITSFDTRFLILTDKREPVRQILINDQLRADIKDLFNLPVRTLYANANRIWIKVDRYKLYKTLLNSKTKQESVETQIRQALTHFCETLADIPKVQNKPTPDKKIAFLFICAHAALFVGAFLALYPIFADPAEILDLKEYRARVFLFSAVFVTTWLILICINLKRSPWFPWVLADFVVFGIIGVIGTSSIAVREINIRLDLSPPRVEERTLLNKNCELYCRSSYRKHARTKTFHLSGADCTDPETLKNKYKNSYSVCRASVKPTYRLYFSKIATREILIAPVSWQFYRTATPGHAFDVHVHEGTLDIEWYNPNEIIPTD